LGSYHSNNENGRFLVHGLCGHGGVFGVASAHTEGIRKVNASGTVLKSDDAVAAEHSLRESDEGLRGSVMNW
jgi:hypothetical protein